MQIRETRRIFISPRLLVEPGGLLRAEGLTLLAVAIVLYGFLDASWLVFVLAFMLPDGPMVAYRAGHTVGTAIYNLSHALIVPVALLGLGIVIDVRWMVVVAMIWLAHIGVDRAIGYGLKYPTGDLRDTHLQRM